MLGWIDQHAAVFLILGLIGLAGLGLRVFSDEQDTKTQATKTRLVQIQGGPVAKCLLEVMEAVAPLLERVPAVEKPLEAYVKLQTPRYPGVKCPDDKPLP